MKNVRLISLLVSTAHGAPDLISFSVTCQPPLAMTVLSPKTSNCEEVCALPGPSSPVLLVS